jgi:hypothetical protein
MNAILVLGPTKWRARFKPSIPEWIAGEIPKWWKHDGDGVLQPVDIRAYLVEVLRKDHHKAALMEAEVSLRTAETNTGFFVELLKKLHVERFFAFWPRGVDNQGLMWESGGFGVLIELKGESPIRFAEQPLDLFPEKGVGDWDPETGEFIFRKGRGRTRYEMDYSAWGARVWLWSDYEELVRKVRAAAVAHPPSAVLQSARKSSTR